MNLFFGKPVFSCTHLVQCVERDRVPAYRTVKASPTACRQGPAVAPADHLSCLSRDASISYFWTFSTITLQPSTNISNHVQTSPTINGLGRALANAAAIRCNPSALRKTTLHSQPRSATRPGRSHSQTQPRSCACTWSWSPDLGTHVE